MSDTFVCPNCYAEVPDQAPACPECGADEHTGWSTSTAYDGLYLSDDEPLDSDVPGKIQSGLSWTTYLTAVIVFLMIASLLVSLGQLGLYLIVPLFFLMSWALWSRQRSRPGQTSSSKYALYQNLLHKARGNEDLVERWIHYEAGRNPDGDQREWMEDAIYRWERDNH